MIKKSVLLTALAIAGFAVTSLAQTVPNYVPTNGLVGWWPFNGNAIDESINTNDGTVNGATLTADRFGNANSAYSFDGINDFVSFNSNFIFHSNGDKTLSFWFNSNNINTSYYTLFFSKLSLGDFDRYNFYIQPAFIGSNLYRLAIDYREFNNNQHVLNQTPFNYFNSSTWNNIVLVRSANTYSLYINGILYNNVIDNSPNVPINSGWQIGAHPNGQNNFSGTMDDIGTWNRALTQSEITGLYNANITGFNPVTYQNKIKIWPNPTNDHITIDNGNLANFTDHQIKISNALGQQVFQSAITQQQFYVDMSTWGGNGIYFVNLINAQGVTIETRKIVLQ